MAWLLPISVTLPVIEPDWAAAVAAIPNRRADTASNR
jgi:hypothetical protein